MPSKKGKEEVKWDWEETEFCSVMWHGQLDTWGEGPRGR